MDQTNPQGGVGEMSDIDRVANFLTQQEQSQPDQESPEAAPEAKPEQQPESQAQDGELSADDLPDETSDQPQNAQQPVETVFEIVHDGQTHKIASREEQIKLMQQGFDYTRKTQRLAEDSKAFQQRMQALNEIEQVQPHVLKAAATVEALGAQLAQYQNVDWVQIATDDPVGYAPKRAQYDTLVHAYQRAANDYQQVRGAVSQRMAQIRQQQLQQEAARLPEFVKEWADPQKLDAGKDLIRKYIEKSGFPVEQADRYLDSAFALATAYKAAKYDQLVASKAEKVKQLQTKPPVTVPGAKSSSAKQQKDQDAMSRLRKTGDLKDAAAVLLNRL